MRKLDEDHQAWLRSLYADDGEEAPTQEPGQQGHSDASLGEPATPGRAPAGRIDPHAADLERARAIRDMPMAEYARRRAELGVRSGTDMSHLFDH